MTDRNSNMDLQVILDIKATYNDSEDVLGTGLMVQPLSCVDGSQSGMDAEQTHTALIYGALHGVGEPVMLVTVWCKNLDHFGIGWCILRNGNVVGWLGEDGCIVIVVHNGDVNLEHDEKNFRFTNIQKFNIITHVTTILATILHYSYI